MEIEYIEAVEPKRDALWLMQNGHFAEALREYQRLYDRAVAQGDEFMAGHLREVIRECRARISAA